MLLHLVWQGRLTEERRWRVVFLSTEKRLSGRPIAKNNILAKYRNTGGVQNRRGRGRKRKIPKQGEGKILRKAKKKKPATVIAREISQETGTSVHPQTIGNVLHRHNRRWLVEQKVEELSAENQAKRLAYAREMRENDWRRVLFSDEKTFLVDPLELTAGKSQEYAGPARSRGIHPSCTSGLLLAST